MANLSSRIGIGLSIILIATAAGCQAPTPPEYMTFAQCLSDKGAAEYGAYWCPHCANQKAMFGDAFEKVKYVECDPRGENANPKLCAEKKIEGYPTWVFADGTRQSGVMLFQSLAKKTGCTLPPGELPTSPEAK